MATKRRTQGQRRRSTATARVSSRSKSRRRNDNRPMILGIILVVITFCTILFGKTWSAYQTLAELNEQKKELTQEYNEQLELSEELKAKEEYVQTNEYIEEMARKMGLVYPDEVIFKPKE